jgi:hypothetical protein
VTQARVHRPGAWRRVALSALVLTPSPAAPEPAHATRVTGYEPQRSGVLGDKQPAHFTIEAIHCIPSCSYRSLEPHKLAKRLACYPPRSPRAHWPLPAFVGPLSRSARARTLFDCATSFRHSSKSFLGLQLRALVAAIRLRPSPPPSARSSSRNTPRIPPAGLLGISGRFAAATSPRSPATHRHRCRINRSSAPSPPQPGVVRYQPGRPRSSPFSPHSPSTPPPCWTTLRSSHIGKSAAAWPESYCGQRWPALARCRHKLRMLVACVLCICFTTEH